MSGPLSGLVVVDASMGMTGAVGTMLLADYGADVVKVERPNGGLASGIAERKAWDRGKSSVVLDDREPSGQQTLTDLVAGADVFVESITSPGRETQLSYSVLRERYPTLIQWSISGYGQDDHPWRDRPAHEALVAARMGFMAEQPGHRTGPIFLGHPSVGYTGGLLGAIGVLTAIRARHLTGKGQQVDVSLLDGVLGQTCMNWWYSTAQDSYLGTAATGTFGRRRLVVDMFPCGDGEYIMVHTGGRQGSFRTMMEVLGIAGEFQTVVGRAEDSVDLSDHEYEVVRTAMPERWRSRSRDEWVQKLQAADVAAVAVLKPGEVLKHEQVAYAELLIELEDPELTKTLQLGPGIRMTDSPPRVRGRAPIVGEHDQVLPEILQAGVVRQSKASSGALPENGPDVRHPLVGINVLDFSSYFAAGYGAKLLSDMGANVIKVEAPSGDAMRVLPDPFEGCQRGKRSIVVDLRVPAGREVVYDLVKRADVVVHNLRPGKADKVGIGYEQLRAINSSLIYCYQPGWGSEGPSANLKSFAPLMSALCGLMFRAAGEGNPPVKRARASEDYYGGLLGAVAVLMALEHRTLTGHGQYLEVPQLHAALFVVSENILDVSGTLVPTLGLDRRQYGYSPVCRLYEAVDGWICVACTTEDAVHRFGSSLELTEQETASLLSGEPGTNSVQLATEEILEKKFSTMTAQTAVELLDRNGVPAEIARDTPFMPDFFWEEWALRSGRVFEHDEHPQWGYLREIGQVIRFSEMSGVKRGPAPMLGEHTVEILEELGYSSKKIDELLRACCIDGGLAKSSGHETDSLDNSDEA
jgi:crotonobetainyl-CoA:carnitine CoA-transferase CaiB-like acyl-CoA transferase